MIRLAALAVGCLMLFCAADPASAQATRTFVSALGDDNNACTVRAPCRSLQKAHDTTTAGGEIDVLSAAGYGALTISKAISIQGHGYARVSSFSGAPAITVAAGSSDKINLSGLVLEGLASGGTALVFNAGASLNIQGSVIRNFTAGGIAFQPSAASALSVSDTSIDDNAGAGVLISPSAGSVTAILDRVQVNHDDEGVTVGGAGASTVMIRDSTIGNNQTTGISATSAGAVVRLTRSTVTANGTGLSVTGGSLFSYSDNSIDGNTTDGSATNTIPLH